MINLDDKNVNVHVVSNDGEILNSYNSEEIVSMSIVTKNQIEGLNRHELELEQKNRPFFKVFQDCMCDIYKLKGCVRNVYDYICETVCIKQRNRKDKLLIQSNAYIYKEIQQRCKDEKGTYSARAIKAAFSELEEKGFIIKYKDEDGFTMRGLYVVNPKYVYSGTPSEYVNDIFEFSKKGILILFDNNGISLESK